MGCANDSIIRHCLIIETLEYLGTLLQQEVVEMGTSLPGLIDFCQAWGSHLSALPPYASDHDPNTTPAVILSAI